MAELAQISPAARPPGWTGLSTGFRRGDRPDPGSVPQADASHALAASERPLNHLFGRGAETAVAAQPTPIRPVEPVHLHGTALDRGPRTRRDRSASLRPGSAHLEPQAGRQIVFQILEGGSLRARCRDGEKQCGSDKHRGLRPRSIGQTTCQSGIGRHPSRSDEQHSTQSGREPEHPDPRARRSPGPRGNRTTLALLRIVVADTPLYGSTLFTGPTHAAGPRPGGRAGRLLPRATIPVNAEPCRPTWPSSIHTCAA